MQTMPHSALLTLSVPTTYIYVISAHPLGGQRRTYTSGARRAFFHLKNARGKLGCMKSSLCPKNSSLKDDSNDTKNETEKRILPFFMIGQSFVKSIGVFPGPWSTFLQTHAVLRELIGTLPFGTLPYLTLPYLNWDNWVG